MTIEGSLAADPIAEVLLQIADAGRTGILTIQGEEDIVALSFLDGGIVAADALNQTVEDGLREIMVERGDIERETFVALASEHHAGGGRVLDLLVERDYIDRATLLEALREQTERVVLAVMKWRSGDYKFYGGNEVFSEEGFEPVRVEEALLRAAVELGADGPFAGSAVDPEAVYEVPGDERPGDEGPEPGGVALSEVRRRLLELADGERTAADLVAAAGLDQARGLVALQRLESAGRLRRRSTPTAEPAVRRPPEREPEAGETPVTERDTIGGRGSPVLRAVERLGGRMASLSELLMPWGTRLFGAVLAAGVLAQLAWAPLVLFHPFPWERGPLEEMRASRQETKMFELDRAAHAYHLLEGRFPEDLGALVSAGLLSPPDRVDAEGRLLTISSSELSYVVLALQPGAAEAVPVASAQVIGDALLDSAFLVDPASGPLAPLVLLD